MKTTTNKRLSDFSSGQWNGFYLEKHETKRGWMHLYLEFKDGSIRGEGTDYVGPWVLEGSYEDSGRCHWTKKYMGKHTVKYRGQLGEQGITGSWSIAGLLAGPFHIWPTRMTHLNEMYMTEDLERANLRSTSPSILMQRPDENDLPV